jgi:uncharacterized membrane protein SirB2
MGQFYPGIKLVHIACVIASGSLFGLRGMLTLANNAWANHVSLRRCSYVIDTVLLSAGLSLAFILKQLPIPQAWLSTKLLLLVVYIVLGIFALRRGRTRASRSAYFAAALLVYGFMVGVAVAHRPLGFLVFV